jgi:hypothetical protein
VIKSNFRPKSGSDSNAWMRQNLSLDTEKVDKLVANRVVADVDAESRMAKLFGDEQKETAAAAEIQNFLRTRPIQLQLPDARDVSFEPALGVGVLRVVASGGSVARLNIAQALLVNLRQEQTWPE